MELIRKPESNQMHFIGDNGLKKMTLQFVEDDFAIVLFSDTVTIPKSVDEEFYNQFSKLFDNKYLFRDNYSFSKDNVISWVSDEYNGQKDDINSHNILTIIRSNNSIFFDCKNNKYEKEGYKNQLPIIYFTPLGGGRYSRNMTTGYSLQDDIIEAFNNTMNNVKIDKKGRKK